MANSKPPLDVYKVYATASVPTLSWSENFSAGIMGAVCGGIAGGIEVSVLYPAEYLKTQLQLEEGRAKKQYHGIIDCIRKTIKRRGVLGLYRGLTVLMLGTIPRAAARFGSFEYFKSLIAAGNISDNTTNLISGMGAGCFEAVLIVTPLETIRVKFINDQRRADPQLKGLFHGIRTIIQHEGMKGIYRGLTATVLKEGSSSAIRFSIFDYLKEYYKQNDPDQIVPKLYVGGFGAIAGFASVLANTPLDVVKTRMQSFKGHSYKTTMDCFVKILKHEGFFALYKGTVIRLYLVCLSMGISFMAYDALMNHFNEDYLD